jgi:hypothetical protein
MANLASVATDIMTATFEGYGASEWNTPTGARPPADANLAVWMFTRVKVAPSAVLRGNAPVGASLRVRGGTIGCDSESYDATMPLTVGTSYTIFAVPEWEKNSASADPWLMWAWPVNPDGTIQSPLEGSVTPGQLSKAVSDTPLGAPITGP